MTDGATVNNPP